MQYFRTPGILSDALHIDAGENHTGISRNFSDDPDNQYFYTYYYWFRYPDQRTHAEELVAYFENLDIIYDAISNAKSKRIVRKITDTIPLITRLLWEGETMQHRRVIPELFLIPTRIQQPTSAAYTLVAPVRTPLAITPDYLAANIDNIDQAHPTTRRFLQCCSVLDHEYASGRVLKAMKMVR